MDCLSEDALIEFLAGRLDATATAKARAHVARCAICNAIATELIRDAAALHARSKPHTAANAAPAPPPSAHTTSYELAPGSLVGGRYVLERPLGEGGMGVVWKARHRETGQPVAIKLLKAFDARARKRFVREIEVSRGLQHPAIVRVLEALEDVEAGCPALVMELLEGESLDVRLARGPLSGDATSDVVRSVARALAFVHAAGILHRDLKPANVFLTSASAVKVLDLGLAKIVAEGSSGAFTPATRLTETGQVVGTPSYMAPEQLGGERTIDARVDVWSLGAIGYECLVGRRPFAGATLAEVLRSIARGGLVPPDRERPGVPPSLASLVLRMLSPDRNERPPSMSAVLTVLDASAP